MSAGLDGDDVPARLFAGIVILRPSTLDHFVGEDVLTLTDKRHEEYPVLVVLTGAADEAESRTRLSDGVALEFGADALDELMLREVTVQKAILRRHGFLRCEQASPWVSVSPVYLLVDRTARLRKRALEFALAHYLKAL